MENKDILVLSTVIDEKYSFRIIAILKQNDIHTLDDLSKISDLTTIKGIGKKYAEMIRKGIAELKNTKSFYAYLKDVGCTDLEAYNISVIVKDHCNSFKELLAVKGTDFGNWRGIGPKRHQKIIEARNLFVRETKMKK